MAKQQDDIVRDSNLVVPVTRSERAAFDWFSTQVLPAAARVNETALDQQPLFALSAERIAELASLQEAFADSAGDSAPEGPWSSSSDGSVAEAQSVSIQALSKPASLYLTWAQAEALLQVLPQLMAPTFEDVHAFARALDRSMDSASVLALGHEIHTYTVQLAGVFDELEAVLSPTQTATTINTCVREIFRCCRVSGLRPMLLDGDTFISPHRLYKLYNTSIRGDTARDRPARLEWLVPCDETGQRRPRFDGASGKAQPVANFYLPEERGDLPSYQVVLMPNADAIGDR